MKKNLSYLCVLLVGSFLLNACSKGGGSTVAPASRCTTCATAPEAKSTYDNNSGGVYKGTIVGSSGTLKVVLNNGNNAVKIYVSFDNINDSLSTTELSNWQPGQAIAKVRFTGNTVNLSLSISADGSNPKVDTIIIPGHPYATAYLVKETSSALVKVYEGTYKSNVKGDKGVLNATLVGSSMTGIVFNSPCTSSRNDCINYFRGTVSGNTFQGSALFGDAIINGTVNGDEMTGTYSTQRDRDNGTWSLRRTL